MSLWMALLGCVIPYGEPVQSAVTAPLPEPVNFTDLEARLDALLALEEDTSRIEQLKSASQLASQMKTQDPRAQLLTYQYLEQFIILEERASPQILDSNLLEENLIIDLPTINEVDLFEEELLDDDPTSDDPDSSPPDSSPPDSSASDDAVSDESMDTVVEPGGVISGDVELEIDTSDAHITPVDVDALRAECEVLSTSGDLAGALAVLQVCVDAPCWSDVADLWVNTRDRYVYARREAAAELFLSSQGEAPEVRLVQLREVEAMLVGILEEYPDTPYTAAINRHVQLVRETIADLE